MAERNWKESDPHLLLLSKIIRGGDPETYELSDYWGPVLGESPRSAISRFLADGALEPAGLSQVLESKFKVSDLKRMLKERGQKVSGRKIELIGRLIDSDANEMERIAQGFRVLRCSDQGMGLAEDFVRRERHRKEQSKRRAWSLLARRRFVDAFKVVAEYESKSVFPRGLGINWSKHRGETEVKDLETIFNDVPGILAQMDKTKLEKLRYAAAMMRLWGVNTVKDWVPDGFETGLHLDVDTAARMFVFYASNIRDVDQFRKAGIENVEIVNMGGVGTCPSCRQLGGLKVNIDSVPELPNPECTCEIGCRCVIVGDYQH